MTLVLDVQGPVTVAASAKLGKVIDLAWVPLPAPIGGGSVVVVAGEDGSLAVVDATQTVESRSLQKRLAAFKNLVGGRWPFPQVMPDVDTHVRVMHLHTSTSSCFRCWTPHTGARGEVNAQWRMRCERLGMQLMTRIDNHSASSVAGRSEPAICAGLQPAAAPAVGRAAAAAAAAEGARADAEEAGRAGHPGRGGCEAPCFGPHLESMHPA